MHTIKSRIFQSRLTNAVLILSTLGLTTQVTYAQAAYPALPNQSQNSSPTSPHQRKAYPQPAYPGLGQNKPFYSKQSTVSKPNVFHNQLHQTSPGQPGSLLPSQPSPASPAPQSSFVIPMMAPPRLNSNPGSHQVPTSNRSSQLSPNGLQSVSPQLEQLVLTKVCQQCDLRGVNLSTASLGNAKMRLSNLTNANLSSSNLSGAYFTQANLTDANLNRSILEWSNFVNADLSGADLSGADLSNADLTGANLKGANLQGTNLKGAKLYQVDLNGVDLNRAILEKTIMPDGQYSKYSVSPTERLW